MAWIINCTTVEMQKGGEGVSLSGELQLLVGGGPSFKRSEVVVAWSKSRDCYYIVMGQVGLPLGTEKMQCTI